MKHLAQTIPFIATILFLSCRKDPKPAVSEDIDSTVVAIPHELPSDSGTYWVYETFLIDSIGNEMTTGSIDTIWVLGDSTINGNDYIIYKGMGVNPWTLSFLRDSSGYIVFDNGAVFYHTYPTEDTIKHIENPPNVYSWYYKMSGLLVSKTVPYGTFNCMEHNSIAYYSSGDPINVCGDQYYQSRKYFAPYLGMIARQYAYITEQEDLCRYREQRLIDYYHP